MMHDAAFLSARNKCARRCDATRRCVASRHLPVFYDRRLIWGAALSCFFPKFSRVNQIMEMTLKDKVAIVTGGAGGIGRAFCDELVRAGCKVVICDINLKAGEELYDVLSERYGIDNAIFCNCDVTDYAQFEETFQRAIQTFGSIDILINNAGILNDRFWELEVDINFNGVIRGTLLGFRFMGTEKGGRGGTIINIGSNVSFKPYISIPIYTATKHAIVGLTRSFGDADHEKMTGVRVIAVCPAATESNLVQDIKKQLLSPKLENVWKKDIANGRSQKAEFVAKALLEVLKKAKNGSCWLVENNQTIKEMLFA